MERRRRRKVWKEKQKEDEVLPVAFSGVFIVVLNFIAHIQLAIINCIL